jgi:hypothetical protein
VSARPSARLRFLLSCAALPAVAVLGAVAAVRIPAAHADLLPPFPTVPLPLPTLPALPTTGGTTTKQATSTSATTNSGGGGGATTTSNVVPDSVTSGIPGAVRLPSGAVSIPISSVTAPPPFS